MILNSNAIIINNATKTPTPTKSISNFIFGDNDVVVVVGQDGLVTNTLKYLTNQLLIG